MKNQKPGVTQSMKNPHNTLKKTRHMKHNKFWNCATASIQHPDWFTIIETKGNWKTFSASNWIYVTHRSKLKERPYSKKRPHWEEAPLGRIILQRIYNFSEIMFLFTWVQPASVRMIQMCFPHCKSCKGNHPHLCFPHRWQTSWQLW